MQHVNMQRQKKYSPPKKYFSKKTLKNIFIIYKCVLSLRCNKTSIMNNEEIKEQIEAEKKQLEAFLKIAKKFQLDEKEVEAQINFYLEKITELKKKLK